MVNLKQVFSLQINFYSVLTWQKSSRYGIWVGELNAL